jgi:L-threonylcarbamoyladenylate synthase
LIPPELVERAAQVIREGGLVAFPTETVYGLGANALDSKAVARIFEAKGRPQTSPLIVHVSSVEMARTVAREWPASAEALAAAFWPGPLTLVLPKQAQIPENVTAGLDTVGVRMPKHPVALDLIREAGTPVAAPSANRFTELSPTTAEHVLKALGDRVDLILDGGPCQVGIESTVLSLAGGRPALLRPGMISRDQIEEVIGGEIEEGAARVSGAHPSPGMHARHYSPSTPLLLIPEGDALTAGGRGAILWLTHEPPVSRMIHAEQMPADPESYAAILYDTLHRLDERGFDWIAVERPPSWPEWAAVIDRLTRSSARNE